MTEENKLKLAIRALRYYGESLCTHDSTTKCLYCVARETLEQIDPTPPPKKLSIKLLDLYNLFDRENKKTGHLSLARFDLDYFKGLAEEAKKLEEKYECK